MSQETLNFDTDVAHFTPRQMEVCDSLDAGVYKYVLYGGAVGGGKSYMLRWVALRILIKLFALYQIKNIQVMLACEDYPALKDRQISKIIHEIPWYLGRYHDDHRAHGKCFLMDDRYGGGIVCLRNLDDPSKYQCFHPDTEILTSEGWKFVKDVKEGDLAATMDPETRYMSFEAVTKTWEYQFDGEMESMLSRGAPSFCVTPNHIIWATTKRCGRIKSYRADELPATAKIPQWARWNGEIITTPVEFASSGNNGRKISFQPEEWMGFLGWYLGEGSLDPAPRYAIRISQVNETGRSQIVSLLDRIGINYHVREREISFNNKALYEYLEPLGKSHDKHIPREFINLSSGLLSILLHSLVEADGTWVNESTGHFVSASKRLADDVSEIAIRCGFRPTVTLRYDKEGSNPYGDGHKPRFHVHLTRKNSDTICGQHREQVKYSGPVYCVTVPPCHTVLTRYNGRISWSGQSAEFAAILVDELTKNPLQTFTDLRMRLRWPGIPDNECVFIGATNPGGIGHGYCKAYWIDRIYPPEFISPIDYRPLFKFIPSKADDNPHLDASYWQVLSTLPENLRQAFRDGSWDVYQGQAFQFSRETHVLQDDLPIPDYAPLYSTFDWGFGAPFSWLWFWIDADGRAYLFAEWYGWNGTPNQGLRWEDSRVAQEINRREAALSEKYGISFNNITRLTNPDCFQKKPDYRGGGQGPSTAEVFAEHGIYLSPGDPSRSLKIRQFRERLSVPDDGSMPMLMVYPSCEQFIRTIPNIPVDKNDPEKIDDKSEEHCYDSCALLCMSRPMPLETPRPALTPAQRHIEKITGPPVGGYEETLLREQYATLRHLYGSASREERRNYSDVDGY